MSEKLIVTQADSDALKKMPEGWFGWMDILGPVRSPEFRLKRLVARGLVKRKLVGEWPDSEWRYKKVRQP